MLTCSQLVNPANGLVSVSNTPIVPGSTATYSCDDGHRLIGGSSVRVCSNDGMWTGEEPTCEGSLTSISIISIVYHDHLQLSYAPLFKTLQTEWLPSLVTLKVVKPLIGVIQATS